MQQGHVTLADLPKLEEAYIEARDAGEEQFTFNGGELLTSYAKYLIEHLHNIKNKRGHTTN